MTYQNILTIEGGFKGIIYSELKSDIDLTAYYDGKRFKLSKINNYDFGTLFYFSRLKVKSNRINTIMFGLILQVDQKPIQYAIGVKRFDDGNGNLDIESLGSDLEIKIDDSVKEILYSQIK